MEFHSCAINHDDIKSPGMPPPILQKTKKSLPGGAVPPQRSHFAPKTELKPSSFTRSDEESHLGVKNKTEKKPDLKTRHSQSLYLSNDDSMSLASAQRVIYAIKNFLPIYQSQVRPHEFLNYYQFNTISVTPGKNFAVTAEYDPQQMSSKQSLAFYVQGRTSDLSSRKNAVLTFLVDKSGSMSGDGKMSFLKKGLEKMKSQIKNGDVINVVEFDDETCHALKNFTVGRDDTKYLNQTISELSPRGSTDLHSGLVDAYQLAEKSYDPNKINRVILITDALSNTGELDPKLMASIGKYYDTKKIALSGIGLGMDFKDELLDTLTEKGKGAYLFLGSEKAIDKVFGSHFISLLETIARDVHFKTTLPDSLKLDVFYGEEVSSEKEKVQAIHYFANTSQLFLLDLKGKANPNSIFNLAIEYSDPNNDEKKIEEFSFDQASINQEKNRLAKAKLIMAFTKLLEETSQSGRPGYTYWYQHTPKESFKSAQNQKRCLDTEKEMLHYQKLYQDRDTQEIMDLRSAYCARF